MKRWLLIFALCSGSLWAQSGCPYANGSSGGANGFIGGTKISGTSLVSCTPGTDPDCIKAYCGNPNNTTLKGAPNGTVANGLAYSANTAIAGIITQAHQRSMDAYLANGQTSLATGGTCAVFFEGGAGISMLANAPMILPTTGGSCPVANGTPSTFWQFTDPNHNNNTTQGIKVFFPNYAVSAIGTVRGSGGGGSVLIGDTTLTVTIPANRYWPANSDCSGGNTCQLQMENEQATITTQTGSGSGSTVTLTVTRGTNSTSAAAHAADLNGWVLTSIANGAVSTNSPLDLWDAACFFASAVHNGWCTNFDIFGESHGGEMALTLGNSTTAQRSTWLTAGNCEYSETNWGKIIVDAIEPPVDQQAVAVLASDGTESSSNAASLGGVSPNPAGTINATSSGGLSSGQPQNTLWGTYTVTADGVNGGCVGTTTTYSRTGTTALGTYAYNLSPIANLPLTIKAAVSVGLSDNDVCTSVVQNYATAAGIPLVTVTGNHGGDLGACGQAWNPASKMLEQALQTFGIPDCTFGICQGTQVTSGMQATTGVAIQ